MKLDNRWVNAEGELNGLPITIRFREDWEHAADQGDFGICVQIAWNASSRDDSSAYPAQQEMERIEVFHHQLQTALEHSRNAVVAMVITHDGVNQWVIYVTELEGFQETLDSLSAPEQGYPIEVVADDDPEWSTFRKVSQAIAES